MKKESEEMSDLLLTDEEIAYTKGLVPNIYPARMRDLRPTSTDRAILEAQLAKALKKGE